MKKISLILLILISSVFAKAAYILIPMDEDQQNHLKSYGIAFWLLKNNVEVDWLLNYRGGSFCFGFTAAADKECTIRGITYQVIADAQYASIQNSINQADVNEDIVKLVKAPKIAVYSPKTKQPWDDAVTLVLTYAEIDYDIVYDDEILQGKLPLYDWLHLHHEDFTGQYGKFYAQYHSSQWYINEQKEAEDIAKRWGYKKVSQCKLDVVKKIRDFVAGGGYLFAMCSAVDTYDIALAADGLDICESMFDGDPMDRNAQSKLNYENCFAFQKFHLVTDPYTYEYSDIDVPAFRNVGEDNDLFTIFDFSAKSDQIPTMLCQNHTRIIKGFMGQTTAFNKNYIKPSVLVMGEFKSQNEARYIHGEFGKGMWTFYGGHDPEDYQHMVGEPPTDMNLFPNSPGYRLILNNVLFPAAKLKKKKT